MGDKYYLFEDRASSIATILKINTTNGKDWLVELCNAAEIVEEVDYGSEKSYFLSYRDKKGGITIRVDSSGTPILYALDNRIVRQIPIDEVLEYQKKWLREPKKPVEKPILT